ncbi:hypothetical protein [Pyruvatibacter sp.]
MDTTTRSVSTQAAESACRHLSDQGEWERLKPAGHERRDIKRQSGGSLKGAPHRMVFGTCPSPCALAITLQRMGHTRRPRAALWNCAEGAGPAVLRRDQARGMCRPCGMRPLLAHRTGRVILHVPKEASSADFQASAFPLKTGRPGLPLQREGGPNYAGAQSTGDKFLKKVENEYVQRIYTHTLLMRVFGCNDF